jgi:hypothetical protein
VPAVLSIQASVTVSPCYRGLLGLRFLIFFCDVSDKDRELGEAHAEIRALKLSERAREKAVEEVIFEYSPGLCKTAVYVHHFV